MSAVRPRLSRLVAGYDRPALLPSMRRLPWENSGTEARLCVAGQVAEQPSATATTQRYRLEIAFIDLRTKGPLMAAAFEIPHSSHRNCLTPKPPRLTRCGE